MVLAVVNIETTVLWKDLPPRRWR